MTWLQGRGEITYRSQKPLRLRGDVTVAPDGFAIDAMKADIEGGTVEGRVAVSHGKPDRGSRVEAELKAERLDLDAATALCGRWRDRKPSGRMRASCRSISAAPSPPDRSCVRCWPGWATRPKTISLEQLKIGQPENVTLDGAGNFDRVNATGWFALNSSAASLGRMTSLIVPFAPALAARLNAMGTSPGPARLKLALDLDRNAGQADRASARAVLDLDAPQLKGVTTITAKPAVAAIQRHRPRRAPAQRSRDRIEIVVRAGPRLAGAAGPRSRDRGGRGPGAIRGHRRRARGARRCG